MQIILKPFRLHHPLIELEPRSHPQPTQSIGKMGRKLARSQTQIICDMLSSGERTTVIQRLLFVVNRQLIMSEEP